MLSSFKNYFSKNRTEVILLITILLVASFFRLYRISDYMTFLGDEGRDAIVVREILHGNLTLLGPRASAGDFFLGPIYYYMMAPFLLLTNYDPVGPAIMVALIGIATVYLVYHVGREFFGRYAGLIAAALYAISPLIVSYSRSSWNPNPMPFFSLLMLYILYKGILDGKILKFVFVGFLLGIAMQLHYLSTFLAVIVFFFVVFGNFLVSKKSFFKKSFVHLLVILGGFIAGISPFLLFELRHGFPNSRTIFRFIFQDNTSESYEMGRSFVGNIWDVSYRLFARLVTKYPPPEQVNVSESLVLQIWMGVTILLAVLSVFYLLRHKNKLQKTFLILWMILGIGLFGIYKKNIYDYYFGFMFPLPFLLVGNLLARLTDLKKYTRIGILTSISALAILIIVNLSGAPFIFTPNKQKDQAKLIADFVLSKTEGRPFNFALLTRGNSDHVYRYFFETANRAPVTIENPDKDPQRKTVTDQLLIVCEYSECQPLGNPLWEVAGFGRAEVAGEWNVSFVKVYRLVHFTTFKNVSASLPANWTEKFVLEGDNRAMVFEGPEQRRVTIYKNYTGEIDMSNCYQTKQVKINGRFVTGSYCVLEDRTINYIFLTADAKYLIVSEWRSNDLDGEKNTAEVLMNITFNTPGN